MKIGSNAGPFNVYPTIPNVVTPTLCETKVKSVSEVYTPGDTNTFWFAIIYLFYLYKYLKNNEKFIIKLKK